MASSIGTIDVDIVRGLPQQLRQRVNTWQVPGLDGYGAETLGNGNSEFDFQSICYCADNDTANTILSEFLDAIGTTVTITDDWGDAYPNVLLLEGAPAKQPMIWADPDTGITYTSAVRLTMTWKALTSS